MTTRPVTRGQDLLPIGETARICGVATSTLRYYEERGLIAPARRVGGRRWYGRDELRRIVVVQLAQSFGMSLEAIGTYLHAESPAWQEVLDSHIAELDSRVACARSAKEFLLHARRCPAADPLRECDVMVGALDTWIERGLPGRERPGSALRSDFVAEAHGDDAGSGTGRSDQERHDLAAMRRRYVDATLDTDDLAADPVEQFQRWLQDAVAAQVPEPNAMVLATTGADGTPSARTVLLKGLDERGFTFFTNLESAKAADLAANPRAALVFPWHAMERQVRVSGPVTQVSRDETAAYFASRPRESRLGAWASPQSSVVPDRAALDRGYAEMEARWPDGDEVPLPDFWGGYRVRPEECEFWQGRQGRLHDRFRYRRTDAGDGWIRERLAP